MTHFLTLIASDVPLAIAHIEKIEAYVGDKAIGLRGEPRWIDGHKAAEIGIENCADLGQMSEMRQALAGDRIDILCIPALGRRKKLLLADMDSTIVTTETLDELAAKAGIKDKIAAITARAMNGELDFKAALKERVALLKGLPESALEETLAETVLCDGAADMVAGMKAAGGICVLVSGGFTYFTGAIAGQCGFDHHHGNILNVEGGTMAGTVGEPILDKDSKLAFLKRYAGDLGIDLSDTIAIGDGANDLPMLAAAGLGIGYRPKPILEESLPNILKYADLTAVLYAQGLVPSA